ncbi:MAG TPA: histidine phosphatase family protein [Fimbriimonas sp.]|nr:histidine phosphatase family protein [Fimbriimonas sp.]
MRVYFARHGESEANVLKIFANTPESPYGLTDKGRDQAAALAESLAGEGIVHAFASPLKRAQQTAQIVCGRLGIPFATRDALREFGVGNHEGSCDLAAWAEYKEVEEAWLTGGNRQARIGGGECYDDISDRFLPFMVALAECYGDSDDRILLIGHGGTFACMLPQLLTNIEMSFAQGHPLRPASFIKADYEGGKYVCLQWTDTVLEPVTSG